jgi:hypothetical protein
VTAWWPTTAADPIPDQGLLLAERHGGPPVGMPATVGPVSSGPEDGDDGDAAAPTVTETDGSPTLARRAHPALTAHPGTGPGKMQACRT